MKIEFEFAPDPGGLLPVCDGIHWAYQRLPFALDHVNCWLLEGSEQSTLIDTGVNNASTREHWTTLFDHRGQGPQQVLVTHFHPDHMGLAGWFETQGCQQFIGSRLETDLARSICSVDDEEYGSGYAQWYSQHGLQPDSVKKALENGNTYRKIVHKPPADERWTYVHDGQILTLAGREYTVMIGRGHAPDMLMLYRSDDHVLIAADQVLPFISPNVSVMPRLKEKNPLHQFLLTLEHLKKLPEDTLVLPSHGLPFRGLHARLEVLQQHHQQRLEEVLEACREPRTAYDLFAVLFKRKLDAQQTSFALGESLAHLHYLEHQGTLKRLEDTTLTRFLAC